MHLLRSTYIIIIIVHALHAYNSYHSYTFMHACMVAIISILPLQFTWKFWATSKLQKNHLR